MLIEALRDKTEWYKKRGFKFLQKDSDEKMPTIKMYLDLLDRNEIEKLTRE